jgi:hypothetical protein
VLALGKNGKQEMKAIKEMKEMTSADATFYLQGSVRDGNMGLEEHNGNVGLEEHDGDM